MFNHLARLFTAAILVVFLHPEMAHARGALVNAVKLPPYETANYTIRWLNLEIGSASFRWQEDAHHYRGTLTLETTGVAKVFSEQRMIAAVQGIRQVEQGRVYYLPTSYGYTNQRPHKTRVIRILYDGRGSVARLSVNPPDNPQARPPVSSGGQNSAYDPITALMAFIDGNLQVAIFDGRRLTQIAATPKPLDSDESQAGLAGFTFRRFLLEGATPKELKKAQDDRRVMVVMQLRDSRFPERLEADGAIGTIVAERRRTP